MIWSTLGKVIERVVCLCLLAAFGVYLYTSCLIALECRPMPVPCSCEELPWWQVCSQASERLAYGSPYCNAQAEIRRLIWEKLQEIERQIEIIGTAELFPPFPMPPLPTLTMPNPFGSLRDAMSGFEIIPRATWSCSVTGSAGKALGAIGGAIGGGLKSAGKEIGKGAKKVAGWLGF